MKVEVPDQIIPNDVVSKLNVQDQLSMQVCSGLFNREDTDTPTGFAVYDADDEGWLEIAANETTIKQNTVSYEQFMSTCFQKVAKGYISYDFKKQQHLLPSIITLAGVLDAIPFDLSIQKPNLDDLPLATDAANLFKDFSDYQATEYMLDNYINQTNHMAKINPGYDVHTFEGNFFRNLSYMIDTKFTDYSVKEKMFSFYLLDGCIPFTKEHALTERIVKENNWPRPLTVYGYDDTWGLMGYPFEAETTCVKERNMGQVASVGVSNLGFFSRGKLGKTKLKSNPDPVIGEYNSSKTYISFVIGDGDALYDVKGNMRQEIELRVKECKKSPETCYPLLWSISPQLIKTGPSWLEWFYEKASQTGLDYFILPPSGDLYSYPSLMKGEDQKKFVENTENDAQTLDTSGTMAWEWFGSWEHAIRTYFPLYSPKNLVRGFFLINVPYLFPIEAFRGTYKVIGGNSVMFKPLCDWQHHDGGGGDEAPIPDPKDNMTPKELADTISNLAPGTVTYVYMTHDAGTRLKHINECVSYLKDHVQVVNHNNLVDMALARDKLHGVQQDIQIIQ